MNPAGSEPYACNPTDAAAHVLWCKQESRQLLKDLMRTHGIPKDANYEMARAKYHRLKGNEAKAQAIMEKSFSSKRKTFEQEVQRQIMENVYGPGYSGSVKPVAPSYIPDPEIFESISDQVTRLFLANMAKNPSCAEKCPRALSFQPMIKNYGDLRNWLEDF